MNAIEDLDYLLDSNNWFSDDEIVTRIKRRMEIVSNSESEENLCYFICYQLVCVL